jgi:hypothetical protein
LKASATERQLVLSWHSLRCANHPFYACALDSWQLSFKMGNKYVRKGAAAKVAPPSARGPAPARGPASHGRTATRGRAAAAAAAARRPPPWPDPKARSNCSIGPAAYRRVISVRRRFIHSCGLMSRELEVPEGVASKEGFCPCCTARGYVLREAVTWRVASLSCCEGGTLCGLKFP